MATHRETCERLVKELGDRTGIDWTFGYIGNCEGLPDTPAFRDGRLWYAFAAHPGRVGDHRDSIGGVTTSNLWSLIEQIRGVLQLATVQTRRLDSIYAAER